MSTIDCQFPVISISYEYVIEVRTNRQRIESCSESLLKTPYYANLLLVDAAGRAWRVKSASKVKVLKPWRPWHPWTWVQIDLQADDIGRFSLEELQQRLCEAIDKTPELWDAIEDIEETKAWVWSAADIPSLMAQFIALRS